ncbi:cold shock domain-containing protein [Yoonia sp. GPGPB17]|uniref:cold shock domain-containing protein n=1 Tax=Yoonia sp. GPGPB17 TaxID=3026147 RepID=UPI0030BA78EF
MMRSGLYDEKRVCLIKGNVKWFAPSKGYGFVESVETADDILLQKYTLTEFGQSSVAEGSRIEAFVSKGPRGLRVVEVIALDAVQNAPQSSARRCSEPDNREYRPVRVKWYDDTRYYGFVNLFGDATDYFVRNNQLRDAGRFVISSRERQLALLHLVRHIAQRF